MAYSKNKLTPTKAHYDSMGAIPREIALLLNEAYNKIAVWNGTEWELTLSAGDTTIINNFILDFNAALVNPNA